MEDVLADLAVSYREPYRNQAHLEIGKLTASAIKIFEHVERHAKLYTLVIEARALPGFQNRIGDVLRDLILQDLHSYSLPAKMNREL
ncbi:TetR-like C-terminal domain-containing protein [Ectobacillus ponti]|uniref:TetR family transcriptional regulator C-terminal domain-containing protein n=1 Tax=Ectobacillus ponti TaxID=2961894 RepID=A0AA41XAD8_9BACI|nr:TetR-like C-terminal domain-containing protein [Ectobacillus ponti]MCP8969285.1 TetR family transcriptional regulator C-terminal domain-containing protein [Ectobacillus ponti]